MEIEDQEEQEGDAGSGRSYNDGTTSNPSPVRQQQTKPPILADPYWKPRYRECLKNHAVGIGGHAIDGCGEFMPAGEEGTLESLRCAACSCHRNFHRREAPAAAGFLLTHHPHGHFAAAYHGPPAGYLHVAAATAVPPLALPSSSGGEMEDYYSSNPSSSGGGGGKTKRFRTKFTPEQKDRMLSLAARLDWKIQKQDEEMVQHFCNDVGINRHVLKVWMHNNKQTLGKKP